MKKNHLMRGISTGYQHREILWDILTYWPNIYLIYVGFMCCILQNKIAINFHLISSTMFNVSHLQYHPNPTSHLPAQAILLAITKIANYGVWWLFCSLVLLANMQCHLVCKTADTFLN